MSSKTKIIVLHLKELIYTGVFVLLGIIFLVLIATMFLPKKPGEKPVYADDARFVPGKYTTTLQLGDQSVDIEVTVDDTLIRSINLVNLNEVIATMYPLMEPCLETIAQQVCEDQTLDSVIYPDENKYTSQLLLRAIAAALD